MPENNVNRPTLNDRAGHPATPDSGKRGPGWIKWFRWVIAIAVGVALVWMIWKSASQLREEKFDFRQVQYAWWFAALLCYSGTMQLSCHFWVTVLRALGQRPNYGRAMTAFFASQLGKYIPGKAMVVVMRTDLIRGPEVNASVAAASVFVETLTWIFIGSTIASLIFVFNFRGQTTLQLTAAVMALVAGILTWPNIFRAIAGLIVKRKSSKSSSKSPAASSSASDPSSIDLSGLNLKTMSFGWAIMTVGWLLNGFSLWFVLRGLPGTEIGGADYVLVLACVSLATVAGFVSLLPGGLGVRELVMLPLLAPRFGEPTALIAAVMIRIVWLASELLMSAIMGGMLKRFVGSKED